MTRAHIRVLICRVDDEDEMTEVAAFELANSVEVRREAAHALDDLEARAQRTGNAILRRLLHAQWELIDSDLADQYVAQASRRKSPIELEIMDTRYAEDRVDVIRSQKPDEELSDAARHACLYNLLCKAHLEYESMQALRRRCKAKGR